MNESHLNPEIQAELDIVLQPYIERIETLQKNHEQQDTDIVLLTNAAENLARQLDDYRDCIKKLPKGSLNRQV